MIKQYVGLLDIKTQLLLTRFTLQMFHESIDFVVADIEIIDKLLIMANRKYNIAVTSHFHKLNNTITLKESIAQYILAFSY